MEIFPVDFYPSERMTASRQQETKENRDEQELEGRGDSGAGWWLSLWQHLDTGSRCGLYCGGNYAHLPKA
jgi:hypothetical protein